MVEIVINEEHREKIVRLEQSIIKDCETVELEVKHHFAHGTYSRELIMPKGTVLTGKIHRHSATNIVLKGRMLVMTDEGNFQVEAPHIFLAGAGVKKASYALEDTIWLNVYPWDGKESLEEIEDRIIVPSYEALDMEQKGEIVWFGQ